MAMREAFRRAGLQVPSETESENMTTGANTCSNCGNTFEPRHPSHRLCNDCHREQSGSGRLNRRQDRSDRSWPQNIPSFPDSYFGQDSEGQQYLLPEFVSKEKVDALVQCLANNQPRLTTSQARRFFNHCREIERHLKFGDSWEQVSASFESLCVHAQNAASARPSKIPRDFQTFIDDNVGKVVSADNQKKAFLDGFLPHFEALIGYGSAHLRDR